MGIFLATQPLVPYAATIIRNGYNGATAMYHHADAPQITAFTANRNLWDASGAAGSPIILSFAVDGAWTSAEVEQATGTRHAILPPNTTFGGFPAPAVDDIFTLRVTGAGGTSSRPLHYWRYIAPTIDSFTGSGTQSPPFGEVLPRLRGSITLHPWLEPAITLASSSGNLRGFSASQIARALTGTGNTRTFNVAGTPIGASDSVTETFTLGVTLRIGDVDVGSQVTRQVSFSY